MRAGQSHKAVVEEDLGDQQEGVLSGFKKAATTRVKIDVW